MLGSPGAGRVRFGGTGSVGLMWAIVTGADGQMRWEEVPDVAAGPGEVLIEVAAAGVNRADLLQAAGKYPPPPGASPTLGLEVSGTAAACGAGVTDIAVGQPVCALLTGGGYAEFVSAPAEQVLPIPAGVPLGDAAALPEAACTVWSNVVTAAGLGPGEVLLVHGGASGIGTHAIQVARALGARVAVTAGSPAKLSVCRELGAETLICYRDEDFVERVRAATGGAGADVILDIMGGSYFTRNLAALAEDGRLVVIGLQGGAAAELSLASLVSRRLQVIGTTLRGRPLHGPHGKASIVSAVRESLWPMVADGTVRPVIGARFPIERAADAHQMLATGRTVGKVLLDVPGSAQ